MKKHIWVILMLLLIAGFYSCDNAGKGLAGEQKSVIIVYGSVHCNHCREFRAWLEKNNLKYTFHDVTVDMKARKEMMRKVKNSNMDKRVLYPVVDIDGKILSRPEHKTVQDLLKK